MERVNQKYLKDVLWYITTFKLKNSMIMSLFPLIYIFRHFSFFRREEVIKHKRRERHGVIFMIQIQPTSAVMSFKFRFVCLLLIVGVFCFFFLSCGHGLLFYLFFFICSVLCKAAMGVHLFKYMLYLL